MLGAHRFFNLPGQHPFHCGGGRDFKDALLFQKVFKGRASIRIFRHGFHTPFCADPLTLTLISKMLTERRNNRAYQLWRKQDQYGSNRANGLNQQARQRQPDRLAAERNQAEDAVYTALQMVGNDRQAITKVQRHINWHDDKAQGRCYAQ